MKLLLWLYPSDWRERYAEEIEALLEEHRLSPRLLSDARRRPTSTPGSDPGTQVLA